MGRGEARRLPRDCWFGRPTGLYYEFELDRTYRVHRQWYPEVNAADQALREMQSHGNPPESEQS
ncbi:hypothetical protein [Streptomyces sp. NPDC057340]|uniref:hypothetical protein n=1 Tax=Streptomyces sp. NPDC057340 TaxID=3346103 RepID=UPI00363061F1